MAMAMAALPSLGPPRLLYLSQPSSFSGASLPFPPRHCSWTGKAQRWSCRRQVLTSASTGENSPSSSSPSPPSQNHSTHGSTLSNGDLPTLSEHTPSSELTEDPNPSSPNARPWQSISNFSPTSSTVSPSPDDSDLPRQLITFVAIVGVLETAYLTYEKFLGSAVFCPVGGSCNGVLDSPWGTVLGLPLSLYGLGAYSAAALLAQTAQSNPTNSALHNVPKNLLLGLTSVMAATSAYLMYILNTELEGMSCVYCLLSAFLSASLFFCTLRGFSWRSLRQVWAPQAGLSLLVVCAYALAVAGGDVRSALAGSNEIDLPPIEPQVSTVSTAPSVALARHLQTIGAKMYGAFWCSHCFEQKQMFGQEAMKFVDYVECYPEGYRRGVELAPACVAAQIEGFPTWVVNGKVLPGEQDLEQLAQVSGFDVTPYAD